MSGYNLIIVEKATGTSSYGQGLDGLQLFSSVCTDLVDVISAFLIGLPSPPTGAVIPVSNTLPSLKFVKAAASAWLTLENSKVEFDGFPKTLQLVRDFMSLSRLSTTNLSFLSNLVCAPTGFTEITDNTHLTSLSGLQAYFRSSQSFQRMTFSNNPLLLRRGYQPLSSVLQCNGATSPVSFPFSASINDCLGGNPNPLTSVTEFCSYLVNDCA